ncbi:GntR family transcriptional regulator [Aureimonas leprariae]|uniref:GntR family transcriptional regulator n=1 Tax=Plantimonas leprariae TaxID=2615207 RepID=A0A7V7TW15_9HYPH|nr:GntR family transcriptional regulator [Aureimonas leprariae]KAB0678834.1 GntR family transcriptional regulator [Aureimonas leprariae]
MARPTTGSDRVYAALHADIVGMVLPPGALLQDKALAERFGLSRTPIREALIRLENAGLVEIFPQSGTFVSRVPMDSIPEGVAIRKALEGLAVEAAAARITSERLAELDRTIVRQRVVAALGDTREFHEADEAFHEALARISGYPTVWKLACQAKVQVDRARRLTLPAHGRMDQVIAEHLTVRDAIARGDAASAKAAMADHLGKVILDVERLSCDHPEYFV